MKYSVALLALFAYQVSCDWTGSGELSCYSHVDVDADFPSGASNAGPGSVTCTPIDWVFESGLGPEAMFFHSSSGEEFEIWAWDYHPENGQPIPSATCDGVLWYKTNDMGAGFCSPHKTEKGFTGCGMAVCRGDIVCTGC